LYDKQEQSKKLENKNEKKKLFCLLGLLSQEHNIVVYIRSSSVHITRFKKLAKRIILINNYIR
jgi:hypothetical protein